MAEDAGRAQLIETIYEAAIDPLRWHGVLDRIVERVGARGSALLVRAETDHPYEITALSKAYRDFVTRPEGRDYVANLRAHEAPDWAAFAKQPINQPFPDIDVGISREVLDTRPDCLVLERSVGIRRRIGLRLNDNPVWFEGMTIGFDPALAELPEAAFDDLGRHAVHLARAAELSRTFMQLRARYNAALTVLDRVGTGMGVGLPDGRIIVRNRELMRIADQEDGLSLTRDHRIAARDPELTRPIDAAIARASATASGESEAARQTIAVPRRSGAPAFILDIAPLNDAACEIERGLNGALISIIDPENAPLFDTERFARAYELTGAEKEVARLIPRGHTVEEIAQRRGTAPATVKNQLAAMLAKTGARNRLALIHKMASLTPHIS